MAQILGIDIGGTGIKGAPVDTGRGELLAERFRVDTPQPATPKEVARAVAEVVEHFKWKGPVGITLPSVVKDGLVCTAANIDHDWIGMHGQDFLSRTLKLPVVLLNDADAAGIAEMKFGEGSGEKGLVVIVTLGTGIGTALFHNGELVGNSELGHIEIDGRDAERSASNRVREAKEMGWKEWGKKVNRYLSTLESLLWPNLFLIGGGVSKKADKFLPYVKLHAPVKAAKLQNEAGIIGAALAAETLGGSRHMAAPVSKARKAPVKKAAAKKARSKK